MTMLDPYQEHEIRLAQFNRLMQELQRGTMNRNTFQSWEIEILLDIDRCDIPSGSRKELLRRYQKAVQRAIDKGSQDIMLLSQYLEANRARREAQTVAPTSKTA